MKKKDWDTKKADAEFSKFIRARDGKCLHPQCPNPNIPEANLTCSHFWPRDVWPTRFDPDNCVAACRGCHFYKWENMKQGEYRDFMIRRLGARKYNAMEQLVRDYKGGKFSIKHREEIEKCRKYLEKYGSKRT
jgi:5-methylcytosine-specific restriction endonuclease McrA